MDNDKFIDRKGNIVIKPKERSVEGRISIYGAAKQDNKILLVKPNWKDEFELPGGGLKKHENIFQALKREFIEETGFKINILENQPLETKQMHFYADDIDTYFDSKLLFYLVETVGKRNPKLVDSQEIKGVDWIDLGRLKDKSINSMHLEIIENITK